MRRAIFILALVTMSGCKRAEDVAAQPGYVTVHQSDTLPDPDAPQASGAYTKAQFEAAFLGKSASQMYAVIGKPDSIEDGNGSHYAKYFFGPHNPQSFSVKDDTKSGAAGSVTVVLGADDTIIGFSF